MAIKQPRISQLRNLVDFISKTKTQQADFTYTESELVDFQAWGEIKAKPGYMFDPNNDHDKITSTHTIMIRYDDRVLSTHTLKSEGVKYKMISAEPLMFGKLRYLLMKVEQIGDRTLGTC